MNRKVLGLALLALCGATFTTFAQDSKANAEPAKTCTAGKCDKARQLPDPFAGLDISDAQRTKLNDLNARLRQERKQAMEAAKADKKEQKQARGEARKAAKKKYLDEVKAILGPDQYVVFLENFYVNGPANGKFDKARRQGGDNDKMARNNKKDRKIDKDRDKKMRERAEKIREAKKNRQAGDTSAEATK